MKSDKDRGPARYLAAPALFLILSLAATWPLVTTPATSLPLGTETVPTVPLYNVWTVWWNAHSAASGYSGYWDATIFHPEKGAFAFSEPMPLSVVAAPVLWFTGNRILAYNILLILGLWLNGWAAFRLLRRFGFYRLIQWTGGAVMIWLPLIHSWLGVLQLVPVFGILWTVEALHGFSQNPTTAGGMRLGIAFSVTYLMCAYYGLFLLIPLTLSSVWVLGRHLSLWRTWRALGAGLLTAGVICAPVAFHQARTQGLHAPLPQRYLASFSALPGDYLVPPWPSAIRKVSPRPDEHYDGFRLNPGFLKLGLAAAGIGFGLAKRNKRSWTLFSLTLTGLAFALSLGPWLRIFGWQPYMVLVNHVPGFGQARNVFRFAVLVQICVGILAMAGLQGILAAALRRIRREWRRRLAKILVAALGLMAVVEILPPAQPLYRVQEQPPRWVTWLATQTPEDCVTAFLPFPFRPDAAGYARETLWMYWQTFHRRKMANGYSGYFPEGYLELKMSMAAFPAPDTLGRLRDLGVAYCVVERDCIFAETARLKAAEGSGLALAFGDDASRIDIYRLVPNSCAFDRAPAP